MFVSPEPGKLRTIGNMYKAYEIDSLNRQTKILTHALANTQDGVLVVRLSKAVMAMFDATYWFSGFRTGLAKMQLADQNALAGKIITACEKVQVDLKAFYANLSETTGLSQDVAERCSDACESAKLLYEELEMLRWDALECQADASPISDGWFASTPKGVADLFKRLKQEA